jgi:hypothetical protein
MSSVHTDTKRKPAGLGSFTVACSYLAVLSMAICLDIFLLRESEWVAAVYTFISMLMALASLGAIWTATRRWPSHVITLLLILAGLFCWFGVAAVTGLRESDRTAAWAIAFEVQVVLTALLTVLIRGRFSWSINPTQRQFTISTLLIWTAVIAMSLGSGRALASIFGWSSAAFGWHFFWHVQIFAVANGLLASALFAAVVACRSLRWRIVLMAAVTVFVATATPIVIFGLFGPGGGHWWEVPVIYVLQGFLLAIGLLQWRDHLVESTAVATASPTKLTDGTRSVPTT